MTTAATPKLAGIIPPLVTPLADGDHLDVPATERLLEHVVGGGVHGVFALGTTGEGTSLHPRLQQQYVEVVCDTVQRRVPVLVCLTSTSLRAALELAEQSYGAGATALVTAAPFYLPMTQADLHAYIVQLADQLPLPLLLYNMPSCTKTAFALETVQDLSQHPNIVGLKDTSGDLDYFQAVANSTDDDFTLLVGPEELLYDSLSLGGWGGVNGGANLFPQLYVGLYEAMRAGRQDEAAALNELVQQVAGQLYHVSDSGAKVIQGIKTALSELGIGNGFVAAPFRPYDDQERALIRGALAKLEPLLASRMVLPSSYE